MGRRVGFLAGVLVLALGSGVVAQEPSPEPPPWFGGRVEMPEHGFAITLPEDWAGFDLAGDLGEQVHAVQERYEDLPATALSHLRRSLESAAGQRSYRLLAVDCSAAECSLGQAGTCSLYTISGFPAGLDEFGDVFYRDLLDAPDIRDVEPVTVVDLPVEPSVVVRATAENPDVQGDWSPTTMYAMLDDTELTFMVCSASNRPDDDWLSIAETIEFLPDTSAEPAATDG